MDEWTRDDIAYVQDALASLAEQGAGGEAVSQGVTVVAAIVCMWFGVWLWRYIRARGERRVEI